MKLSKLCPTISFAEIRDISDSAAREAREDELLAQRHALRELRGVLLHVAARSIRRQLDVGDTIDWQSVVVEMLGQSDVDTAAAALEILAREGP